MALSQQLPGELTTAITSPPRSMRCTRTAPARFRRPVRFPAVSCRPDAVATEQVIAAARDPG